MIGLYQEPGWATVTGMWSYRLVQNFGMIAVEDLHIKGLSAGFLAKAVHDVRWSAFIHMLDYKAANAGRQVLKVDAKIQVRNAPGVERSKRSIFPSASTNVIAASRYIATMRRHS